MLHLFLFFIVRSNLTGAILLLPCLVTGICNIFSVITLIKLTKELGKLIINSPNVASTADTLITDCTLILHHLCTSKLSDGYSMIKCKL